MMTTSLALCLLWIITIHQCLSADVHRAISRNVRRKTLSSIPRVSTTHQPQTVPMDGQAMDDAVQSGPDILEGDLDRMRLSDKSNAVTQAHIVESKLSPHPATQNEVDLLILYDLIKALEYETNLGLLDQVLKDLDEANQEYSDDQNNIGRKWITKSGLTSRAPIASQISGMAQGNQYDKGNGGRYGEAVDVNPNQMYPEELIDRGEAVPSHTPSHQKLNDALIQLPGNSANNGIDVNTGAAVGRGTAVNVRPTKY